MKYSLKSMLCILSIASAVLAAPAQASDTKIYDVTITNITRGQTFTPIMVATHKRGQYLFKLGDAASNELAIVAESGNNQPLQDALLNSGVAYDTVSSAGLLAPGESVTVRVKAKGAFKYISVASMLIPTNDAFIAINGVRAPKGHHASMHVSPTYDAGSEMNDELCANIPGPHCGGEGISAGDGGEGFVHVHAGIHGIGDLAPATFDWRNPTAKVVITWVK